MSPPDRDKSLRLLAEDLEGSARALRQAAAGKDNTEEDSAFFFAQATAFVQAARQTRQFADNPQFFSDE